MGLIKFLKKRPSDKTIRISRIVFGLILIGALFYNLIYLDKAIDTEYFGQEIDEKGLMIAKYIMISLGIIPLIMGVTNICLLKSKYMRIMQIFYAIVLFYVSSSIAESPDLDIDVLVGFMGLLPLIAGITGKCITKNCLRYGEKVTKIRV
ncbi:hypothetical protein CSB07_00855 [Candidatus Gracilibacteria bacterium]|nr:MAG: hypothetical protein CSB07_00855 [Candidatus Gracilibacteria bacterium]